MCVNSQPFTIDVMATKTCSLLVAILIALMPVKVAAQSAGGSSAEAVQYLMARQNTDGGYSEPEAGSDLVTTCWVLIAGAAAGEGPLEWTAGGAGPAQFIESALDSTSSLSDLELVAVALSAAGGDPGNVAGRDLTALIKASTSGDGRIGSGIQEHCWGMLALAAAGETVPANNVEWLIGQRRADGGWGESDGALNADTAIAVEALIAAEEDAGEWTGPALKLLRQRMNPDGGFRGEGRGSDVHATSSVMRAISAGGLDPTSESWSFEGRNPAEYLDSMQSRDGSFLFAAGVESQPALTTAMAVPAIARRHFPLITGIRSGAQEFDGTGIDRGMAGAGIATLENTQLGADDRKPGVSGLRSGATAGSRGGAGFWVFVGACAAYLVLLACAAMLARSLSKRKTVPLRPRA